MKRKQLDFEYIKNQLGAGRTTIEIANELGISAGLLRLRLRENNIKLRELHFNHNFFSVIDTEEKAYWLGFLYADGNVSSDKKNKQYRVRIGINKRDSEHIEKWHKAIGSFKSIARYKTRPDLVYSEHNSKKMVQDLIKLGCVPNKSLVLTFPLNLPNDLVKHFIRGYFDGDGGLSIDKNSSNLGQMTLSIVGTIDFLNEVQKYFGTNNKLQNIGMNSVTRQLNIRGNQKAIAILRNLYDYATIYLKRKKQKLDDFIKAYEEDSQRFNFHKPSLGIIYSVETKNKMSLSHLNKKHRNNKTGYVGIYYNKQNHKYASELRYKSKRYFLGYFATAEEAFRMRENKIKELEKNKE